MNDKKIAHAAAPLLNILGTHIISKRIFGGLGHILMFHRVVPNEKGFRIHNHQSLEISPGQLEEIILYLKKMKYNFLSLNELYNQLQSGKFTTPFVVFTFDDGYKDNLTHAYPIFKKYNIPFTIYVTTSFPDYSAVIWWYFLEQYLVHNSQLTISENNRQYEFQFHSVSEKEKAFNPVRRFFIQKADADLLQFTSETLNVSMEEIKKKSIELCLSWDDIKFLSGDPLVTIGAHTVNHVGLSDRSLEEATFEIMESKRIIESRTGKPVEHFSYPFGSKKEAWNREYQLAKEAGFLTATTTRLGNIYKEHGEHTTALPRISINALTSIDVLKMQISGLLPFFRNRGKSILLPQ